MKYQFEPTAEHCASLITKIKTRFPHLMTSQQHAEAESLVINKTSAFNDGRLRRFLAKIAKQAEAEYSAFADIMDALEEFR